MQDQLIEQALAHYLMAYLEKFGADKSAADDIASAALKAYRFANSAILADASYNPEYWNGAGNSAASQDIGAQVSPSLDAMINPE